MKVGDTILFDGEKAIVSATSRTNDTEWYYIETESSCDWYRLEDLIIKEE